VLEGLGDGKVRATASSRAEPRVILTGRRRFTGKQIGQGGEKVEAPMKHFAAGSFFEGFGNRARFEGLGRQG
jgi:hypothetical protein